MTIEHESKMLAEYTLNNDEINRVCRRLALKSSNTEFWTTEEWEQNENTAQYALYWSEYSRAMTAIQIEAMRELNGIF